MWVTDDECWVPFVDPAKATSTLLPPRWPPGRSLPRPRRLDASCVLICSSTPPFHQAIVHLLLTSDLLVRPSRHWIPNRVEQPFTLDVERQDWVPSGSKMRSLLGPRATAMRVPSGDELGDMLHSLLEVSRRNPVPSVLITKRHARSLAFGVEQEPRAIWRRCRRDVALEGDGSGEALRSG